jgi:hypothetical protein
MQRNRHGVALTVPVAHVVGSYSKQNRRGGRANRSILIGHVVKQSGQQFAPSPVTFVGVVRLPDDRKFLVQNARRDGDMQRRPRWCEVGRCFGSAMASRADFVHGEKIGALRPPFQSDEAFSVSSTRSVRQVWPLWRSRMRRSEARQGVRMLKFTDVFGRWDTAAFNHVEAAALLDIGDELPGFRLHRVKPSRLISCMRGVRASQSDARKGIASKNGPLASRKRSLRSASRSHSARRFSMSFRNTATS